MEWGRGRRDGMVGGWGRGKREDEVLRGGKRLVEEGGGRRLDEGNEGGGA